MLRKLLGFAILAIALASCAGGGSKAEAKPAETSNEITKEMATQPTPADTNSVKVEVSTTMGDFTVLIYGDTPKHRDNFVKLVNEHYYDNMLFHRVIKDFMVQTGDPESKTAKPGQSLGSGDPSYTLEAEILAPKHFHKRGALAAARTSDEINPERRSSGSQFYVVTGQKFSEPQLQQMQMQNIFNSLVNANMDSIRQMQMRGDAEGLQALQRKLTEETYQKMDEGDGMTQEMKEAYTTVGGAPHLDGAYTVFGEVISGMDVIDKIEKEETDHANRPLQDVRILSMKIVD